MKHTPQQLIEEHFIQPTREERSSFIGIEIEMPVVSLEGKSTDLTVSASALKNAAQHFGFTPTKFDSDGVCHEAVCEETGDVFSFDCSYNNFEISLGKVRTLHEARARFSEYVGYLNTYLRERGHLLTGMGINPYYRLNDKGFVPSPRYKMLEGYLLKSREWQREGGFHPYCAYPTFSSASQVQLDIGEENICQVIRAFSLAEPIKALLFANSYLPEEPQLLCARDMLWERSTHGINQRNLGFFEPVPQTVGELIDYLSGVSIFCAEREDKYLFFYPIPFEEYLRKEYIEGEYFDGERYVPYRFAPSEKDIATLRTYKQIDLTSRGTLEFRSACTQPFSQAMTVAAFHLGLMSRTGELTRLLRQDTVLYHRGLTPAGLRRRMNRRDFLSFAEPDALKALIRRVLDLCREGLRERGFAEEIYLEGLYERADALRSPSAYLIEHQNRMKMLVEEFARL